MTDHNTRVGADSVPPRPPAASLIEHADRTLRLAVPVMLSRAGLMLLVIVDTAMTGHAGTEQLAYFGLAQAPHFTAILVGVGALLGTIVLTAQADGAGNSQRCGPIWRVALVHAAGYGLLMMLLLAYAGEQFLLLTGQSPALAAGAAEVLLAFAWSMPMMLIYIATTLFLEGINRPLPGLAVMLLANLLNAFLNWLLIFGHWGLPAMGASGAAQATGIARCFMCVAIIAIVLTRVDRRRYGIGAARASAESFRILGRRLRHIGYPMALSQGLESSAFSTMILFAGWIGAVQVAAYQVVLSLVALVFMFALGFSTAASVRVANAVGRRDPGGVRLAGWTAAALAASVLGVWALVFYAVPEPLTAIYTSDPQVAVAASAAVLVAAAVLVPDGLQSVLMGALRGMADVWPATLLFLVSFWLVMIPAGYLMGVLWNEGAVGLVKGILLGCLCASVLLALRFHRVSRRTAAL